MTFVAKFEIFCCDNVLVSTLFIKILAKFVAFVSVSVYIVIMMHNVCIYTMFVLLYEFTYFL